MHRTLMAYVRRVWRQPASTAARLAMIILTRRACSSASSLARTLERRIALLGPGVEGVQLGLPLDPLGASDDEPSEVGAPGLDDSGDERRALDAILAIARRVTAESKLRWLVRFLERTNEAAIVFTEYRDTLMVLERELARFGTCQLHGGLTAAERAAAIQTFTRGDSRMLLATDAASEGLNLQQRCRLVIHLEVPWTPTRIEQRVGRVDRIGQHRIVHEAHVVAAGTVEESRVMRVVQRMAEVALAHESLSLSPVQEQEIAACAIGSEALPPRDGFRPLPAGVVTADFRRQAMAEAARVLTARRLLTAICPSASPPPARPFVAQARRARSGSALWALWLELVDSDGQLLWETLIGVSGPHRWKPPACSRDIRLLADKGWSHVRVATLEHRGFGVADAVFASFGVATAIALDRERAIARAIEHGRARIAAHLIQQGLFDRRAERDAVAQRELAAQTLRRCQARIDELTRRAAADIAVRPAFSLIAW